jgi:hypothetical protein
MLRYSQQGNQGRWILTPPDDPTQPVLVTCKNENGVLSCDHGPARYLVSPEDVLAHKTFKVNGKEITPLPDVKLMLTRFKSSGDPARLAAGMIPVS